jgi:AraC-like DNA-binding protein
LVRWKLLRVCEFIERNLDGSIRVSDLANVAALSVSHFTRVFRESVGTTPRTFILERRIARAKALMLFTQDSLSSIAYACGLADHAHFTRRFSEVVGSTPNRWRRQQRSAVAEHPETNGARDVFAGSARCL